MSPNEVIGVVSGLVCVWLCIRQSIWNWPTGLVSACAYIWVFSHAKLYSDVLLQLVFIVVQIYGWYHWLRGGPRNSELPITRVTRIQAGGWTATALLGTALLGFFMRRFTDAALPYWDSLIAVLSLIATYLLARKVLENWLVWIVVDVVAIGVYSVKGLYPTTGLYAVFLVMATSGWLEWRRSFRKASSGPAAAWSSESSCPLTAGTSS